MDIQVKHGSTDITSRTISYVREHDICTGIGRLQVTLEGTYSTSISPHDTISIYENGDFKVKYYVSDVDKNIPEGTIILQCQDRSKYLVDYFIPDTYTIDYPSTTRYWIEKFFTEAGITFEFTTDSQGNLLSNYTQLGLQPAYDQIMMLCQLSGWYFYFDGNGKAIIGSLTTDLSSGGSIGKDDILNIKKITDDKMLRNRAVVWGQYDPIRREYAYADISKHTPWNYDHNDLRTMVISNNNIPNKSSAYNIANILLKEFAKATVEKHITVHGARDFNLGETLRVDSHVWRGKGLITTFGVTMDRSGGLVTNVILDERCPRLYGFFNFGDYVYVGTFGDGIWRKHIKFDPAWYNFSTGLTNLNITDLHINNGVFGSVSESGELYISQSEEGPWNSITITGLPSSAENTLSGVLTETQMFSGIMARATIVDKVTNNVKFGVDTWSGLNTGDYFLSYSGWTEQVTMSGTTTSGYRGWIVEYDPFTLNLVGELGSGIYPISYSGNYDMKVIDLDNDGLNDYVSVAIRTGFQPLEYNANGYNFGSHTSQPTTYAEDDQSRVALGPFSYFEREDGTLTGSVDGTNTVLGLSVFNNETINERDIVWYRGNKFHVKRIVKEYNAETETWSFSTSQIDSPTITFPSGFSGGNIEAISKVSQGIFRAFMQGPVATAERYNNAVYTIDWDSNNNVLGSATLQSSLIVPLDPYKTVDDQLVGVSWVFFDDTLYIYITEIGNNAFPGVFDPDFDLKSALYFRIYKQVCGLDGTNTADLIYSKTDFNESVAGFDLDFIWDITANLSSVAYQGGSFPRMETMIRESNSSGNVFNNHFIYTNDGTTFLSQLAQTATSSSDPDFFYSASADSGTIQLTGEQHLAYGRASNTGGSNNGAMVVYNGTTLTFTHATSTPFQYQAANIYPIFGANDDYYIAKDGSDYYFCNPQTFTPESLMLFPEGYTPIKPISSSDSFADYYYWQATDDLDETVILRSTSAAVISIFKPSTQYSHAASKAFLCGNFMIDYDRDYSSASVATYLYINNYQNIDFGAGFLVLKRDGSDFSLIQEAAKPIRIDISNNSPLLSVQDAENTYVSSFVYGNQVTQIITSSGTREVRDYRYALLETQSGVVVTSGFPVSTQLVEVSESGIFTADVTTFSGGIVLWNTISSGLAERVETTNFVYPGQFIFVTTSGDNPMFYQKDNDGLLFVPYSGLPDSRATIIRVDDRM